MRWTKLTVVLFLWVVCGGWLSAQEVFPTNGIDMSPNSQWIATTNGDHRIRVWNTVTGMVERTKEIPFSGTEYMLSHIKWSPSGDRLAFVVRTRTTALIQIVNATTLDIIVEIKNGDELLDFIADIEWSPDGTLLAGSSQRGVGSLGYYHVKVWNATSGALSQELRIYEDGIDHITWNPNPQSQKIAMTSTISAQIWDLGSDEVINLIGHDGHINSITWNPDGSMLATRDVSNIRIWDGLTGQLSSTAYVGTANSTSNIIWLPDNRGFLTEDIGDLYVTDMNGVRISTNNIALADSETQFDIDSSGQRIVTSPDSGSVIVYQVSDQAVVPFLTPTPSLSPTATVTP